MRGENLIKKNELKDIVRELEKKTNYRWVVFYRAHQFEKEKAIYDDDIINCTDYADVQEILIASDLLISDYSSLMSDYSELERPIISYIPDYEKYMTTERSFYIPCNEWPYMVAKSINEIIWEIWNYDKEKYIKRLRLFKDKLGYLGNGESTQMFIRSILGI